MTVAEIKLISEAYGDSQKREIKSMQRQSYNTAYLTASFVSRVLAGKSIPSFDSVFEDESEEKEEQQNLNEMYLIKERMLDFAREANKKFKK